MKHYTLLIVFIFLLQNLKGQEWVVRADNVKPDNYYGVTVANGMIGIVSSPYPFRVKDVVLNGVYDNYQRGRVSNIVKTFNHVNLNLDINGRRVGQKNIKNFSQSLNMKKAELVTVFDVDSSASVTHTIMALRHLPFSALTIVEIKANSDIIINPASVIEAPDHLVEIKNMYSEVDRPHVRIPLLTSIAKSPSGKHTVAVSNSFIFNEPHGQEPDIIHEDWDYNMHLAKFYKKLSKGQSYTFSIVSTATSTEHFQDPLNEAERLTIFSALERTDRLLARHYMAWKNLWGSDIVINGDEQAQKDVRLALYHLYSFVREGTGYSLSPMGLSGLGYNGHVFWDTELWMYPPLLVLQPNIARSILEYRFNRLDAAKRNAFSHGYRGAMFPWESSSEGSEDTPVWALTGPFQHHITGCVGWAAWKYYQVTKDKVWLRDRGFPILKEVADFWTSRVERNGPGKYDINNVIGANEWQENIDNNAFTNGMAITVLRYASLAAGELGIMADPDWEHVAQNIPILKFQDGTTKENASYKGEPIKQADVNLLAYPLEIVNDKGAIQRDVEYYEPKYAADGPAMGVAILSTLYSRLNNPQKAYHYFVNSYSPNKVPPFGVLSETAGGTNPYFATGAGGMLQSVIFGFGGLQISDAGVTQLKTKLPLKWKELEIHGVGVNKLKFVVK